MSSSIKRRRVTAVRRYPVNELFKHWLEELKDRAASTACKTQYVFGKALRSVQKCPLELKSAEDTRSLEFVGDKTVKLLGDKLREFIAENGAPTFENIHAAGVIVDDTGGDGEDGGDQAPPKKRATRKSNPREYIPGYRTGGYAIIRTLYDAYNDQKDDDNGRGLVPFIEKRELQESAQRYCDESLKTATRDKPYTAWNSVNTLLKHDLVKMNRAKGSTMQYALTEAGVAMGKRLTDVANGDGTSGSADSSMTAYSSPATNQVKKRQAAKEKDASESPTRRPVVAAAEAQGFMSPTQRSFEKNGSPTSSGVSKKLSLPTFSASAVLPKNLPSPSPPRYDDYVNDFYDDAFDYGFDDAPNNGFDDDPEPAPLSKRISEYSSTAYDYEAEKSVELGYVYIDSEGFTTRVQDKAYFSVDDSLWCLVETTNAYVEKVGRERFRECGDLPSSISSKFVSNDGHILMYFKSDFADDHAPGILETREDFEKSDTGEMGKAAVASTIPSNNDELLATSSAQDEVFEKLNAPSSSTALSQVDSLPSTSAVPSPKTSFPPAESTWTFSSTAQQKSSQQSASTLLGSQGATPNVIILEPGQFDIVLVVDYREVTGGVAMFGENTKNRKAFLTEGLKDSKIDYVERRLPVGDYLFVAREKRAGAITGAACALSSESSIDRELVLGPIIERKRMDDLASSIIDKRYKEQKLRLHRCGVYKVIYLIEDYGRSMATFGTKEEGLWSAIVGTQVCDRFDVVRKKNSKEVTTYLCNILKWLQEQFGNKRLISRQPDSLSVQELIDFGADEIALPTYQEYDDLSVKRRPLTVGDAFARSLLQVRGISAERAEAIRKVYPTMAHLMEAYERCDGDESKEDALLEAIPCGQFGSNLGMELSKKIARFFCAVAPFTK